ncbi:MAG: flagellar biosynthetic protein FliO [Aquabacterium sp.]
MPSSGLTVLWFLGIVALIPLTLWGLKRSGLASGAMAGAQALIKPVGQYNIGPGQRVVTVEVGSGDSKTWLVLGVTAQSINTLHTMAPQAMPAAGDVAQVPAFTTLLRRAVSGDKGQGS